MSTESERKQILTMIDSGKITPGQGVKLLQALDDSVGDIGQIGDEYAHASQEVVSAGSSIGQSQVLTDLPISQTVEQAQAALPVSASETGVRSNPQVTEEAVLPPAQAEAPDFERWRRWMVIPLWIGLAVALSGVILLTITWMATKSLSFWFACAWVPFLFGIGLIILAGIGRSARWLHLRIQQDEAEWPQKIAISLPLPLGLLAWMARTFGDRTPGQEGRGMDQMILALQKTSPERPFSLEVEEGEHGERVQVYIG